MTERQGAAVGFSIHLYNRLVTLHDSTRNTRFVKLTRHLRPRPGKRCYSSPQPGGFSVTPRLPDLVFVVPIPGKAGLLLTGSDHYAAARALHRGHIVIGWVRPRPHLVPVCVSVTAAVIPIGSIPSGRCVSKQSSSPVRKRARRIVSVFPLSQVSCERSVRLPLLTQKIEKGNKKNPAQRNDDYSK